MAQTRDLYEVLGVPRDASTEEIRRAFRKLAREHHPDVNDDPQAEHRFKEINLAYETLSDPEKRRRYDRFGGEGLTPDMFSFMGDFTDIFEAFFGSPFGGAGRPPTGGPARGADVHLAMSLTFEEAAFGVGREIPVERRARCETCRGSGAEPGTSPTRCATCEGRGQVSEVRRSVFGTVMTSRACGTCRGSGRIIASPCGTCRGEGRVARRDPITVDIPAGVGDGVELRVEGRGDDGVQGGPPGDLYLTLRVERHPVFERRGSDLACTLELPATQAMLGTEVEVPTLDGTAVVKLSAGTRPGTVVRVRGAGLPHLGRRGRGDLYVEVDVEVPEGLPRNQRALVEELADLRDERPGKGPVPGRLRRRE
jgi:molecular chaperone DnaJ